MYWSNGRMSEGRTVGWDTHEKSAYGWITWRSPSSPSHLACTPSKTFESLNEASAPAFIANLTRAPFSVSMPLGECITGIRFGETSGATVVGPAETNSRNNREPAEIGLWKE